MIANSDCPLEEFGSIERVREGILTSLHDAVFFIRFNNHDDVYKKKVKVIIAIKPLIITMTIIKESKSAHCDQTSGVETQLYIFKIFFWSFPVLGMSAQMTHSGLKIYCWYHVLILP